VVHGDAHPMNVLWNNGVVALLDREWVRLGGPELEIEPFLYRGLESDPSLIDDSRRIMGWLAQAHPDAFETSDLVRRVWLFELAYTLRHLLLWPPDRPEHLLPRDHPLPRIRRIVTGPHHLEAMLPRF
jgi:aminoglycoside phosphotransferase (APT) family kinase protein